MPSHGHNEFQRLMADINIRRDVRSIDDPKRNMRVGSKLALVTKGGMAACLKFQAMSDGVEFAVKAPNYGHTSPKT